MGLTLFAMLLAMAAFAGIAEAKSVHPYLGLINGSETQPGEEFSYATGVSVDDNGYVYVTSYETSSIDVFNPAHKYVTSILATEGPIFSAVDSEGDVYVIKLDSFGGARAVELFSPDSYPPISATVYTPSLIMKGGDNHSASSPKGIAVNPQNDHLLIAESGGSIAEYKSAAEGSGLISASIAAGLHQFGTGKLQTPYEAVAVDGDSGDIYLYAPSDKSPGKAVVAVLKPDGSSIINEITGAGSPAGSLSVSAWNDGLAVDQTTGHIYITQFGSQNGTGEIYEFEPDGTFVSAIGPSFGQSLSFEYSAPSGLAVDNSSTVNAGNVYIGSGAANAVVYEFGPLTELFELSVTKEGTGSGNVSSSPAGIDCGSTCSIELEEGSVTLTQSAGVGSEFAGWSGCDSEEEGGKKCVVTLDEAKAVTATFNKAAAPNEFPLSVSKAGAGSGTVTSTPAGIDCGSTCSAEFQEGEAVSLSAAAATGSSFAGWTGACTGTGACEVTIAEAASVTATFNAQSNGGGGGGTNNPPPPAPTCATDASLCPPSTATAATKAQVKAGKAALLISCPGPGACAGKLTLTAKITTGKGKKKKTKTVTIGSASFSLKGGESTTAQVKLTGPAKSTLAKGALKAKLKGTGIAPGPVKLSNAKGK
jgi:hypothetical protein